MINGNDLTKSFYENVSHNTSDAFVGAYVFSILPLTFVCYLLVFIALHRNRNREPLDNPFFLLARFCCISDIISIAFTMVSRTRMIGGPLYHYDWFAALNEFVLQSTLFVSLLHLVLIAKCRYDNVFRPLDFIWSFSYTYRWSSRAWTFALIFTSVPIGTPLQNNLTELWSLLSFLMPDVLGPLSVFLSFFDFSELLDQTSKAPLATYKTASSKPRRGRPSTGKEQRKPLSIVREEAENRMVSRLRDVLDSFVLRRLKRDVQLDLPPKCELLVYAPMSGEQADWYRQCLQGALQALNFVPKTNTQDVDAANVIETKRARKCNWTMQQYVDWENEVDLLLPADGAEEQQQPQDQVVADLGDKCFKNGQFYMNRDSMASLLTTLRKLTMHPHLLRCPLDEHGLRKLDERLVYDSGKMRLLDQMLMELKRRGHKVLIFSQYVQMLHILASYCDWRGFNWRTIDGSMSLDARDEHVGVVLVQFNHDVDVFCMLVSTRAGGLGLNLTAADTVIIYDSDWNPQADLQAQDRAHRIGQTRPVVVYRLACRGSIDQRMLERAQAKRRIEKLVISDDRLKNSRLKRQASGGTAASTNTRLTKDELLRVLSSSDYHIVDVADGGDSAAAGDGGEVDHRAPVLTPEALHKLMDRPALIRHNQQQREQSTSVNVKPPPVDEAFEVLPANDESHGLI